MPVSLDEMMREMSLDARAAIERNASALAVDYRLQSDQAGIDAGALQPSERIAVGTKATTGQRCPGSGIWRVEETTSATAPIAIHNVMPSYGNRPVTWVLVQQA